MEIQYRSMNGRLFIKVEGANQKEVFERLASAQEVFEADDKCGVCGGNNLRFRVRHVAKGKQNFDYYEMVCTAPGCHARLAYGQSTDTVSLFPKRKNEAGDWLPNRGWAKWQGNNNEGDQQ
jgi:hypothetical protein